MSERTWLYGLTADEWFHLACEGGDSEVAPCCGNIGAIRDTLRWLATSQGEGEDWVPARTLVREYSADGGGHDLTSRDSFPLLHRVLDGIHAAHPDIGEEEESHGL
jgi:hypothetical protein